jgi:hypothetical protein
LNSAATTTAVCLRPCSGFHISTSHIYKRGCFCKDVSVTDILMPSPCHPLNIFFFSLHRPLSLRVRPLTGFSLLFAQHRIESKISGITLVNPDRQAKLCIIISLNRPLRKRCNIALIWFHIFFLVLRDLTFSVPSTFFPLMQTKHTLLRPASSCLALNP